MEYAGRIITTLSDSDTRDGGVASLVHANDAVAMELQMSQKD